MHGAGRDKFCITSKDVLISLHFFPKNLGIENILFLDRLLTRY